MSRLRIENLQKTFPDGTRAVKGSNLCIDAGEFVVLLGPSGCGKTTTLRMIAGLEKPSGGRIELADRDVTHLRPAQRDVGFVFQFYALYPHLSARENIAFPLRAAGIPSHEREAAVNRVADRLAIKHLLESRPSQLSGGDQQRVSLGRAMIRTPSIYLMDEPLGTLDSGLRLDMREFIRSQQLELKVTTIYVTHDQEEAMSLADRIVVMHQGEIMQVGSPASVYDDPANLFVARFVGSPGMNLIEGEVRGNGSPGFRSKISGIDLPCPISATNGAATLGVRPEYLRLDPQGPIPGQVSMTEYMGSASFIHVDAPFGRIVVRSGSNPGLAVGDSVKINYNRDQCRIFDATGDAA
jgi:ABC-type sugar transport system ATPase subunit